MTDPRRAIEAVFRIESARLIAGLVRITRDLGLAEELAQEALVTALTTWPGTGVPDNPGAWLMTTAKHRALDQLRRARLLQRKHEELGVPEPVAPDLEGRLDGPDSSWSTPWPASWPATTCCPASAATCSRSWAASRKPAPSSTAPQG